MNLFLKSLSAYGKYFLGIWNQPKRYNQLYSLIDSIKPKNIMEIGTWRGERAKLMIQKAQKNFPAKEIFYYGFDLFETLSPEMMESEKSKQPPSLQIVKKELEKTGSNINLYKGDTHKILPEMAPFLPKMDFIFIDGGHSLETVKNDWNYASRLMHDRTVAIFDDYWPNRLDVGAKPIVDAIDKSAYDVEILPEFDVFIKPGLKRLIIKFAQVKR